MTRGTDLVQMYTGAGDDAIKWIGTIPYPRKPSI